MDRLGAAFGSGFCLRFSSDERDLNAGVGQISGQVVDMALETAMPVQRIHRPRDDGNAQRWTHFARLSTRSQIEPLDALRCRGGVEQFVGPRHRRRAEPASQAFVVSEPADVVREILGACSTGGPSPGRRRYRACRPYSSRR